MQINFINSKSRLKNNCFVVLWFTGSIHAMGNVLTKILKSNEIILWSIMIKQEYLPWAEKGTVAKSMPDDCHSIFDNSLYHETHSHTYKYFRIAIRKLEMILDIKAILQITHIKDSVLRWVSLWVRKALTFPWLSQVMRGQNILFFHSSMPLFYCLKWG